MKKNKFIIFIVFLLSYILGIYAGITSIDIEKNRQKKYINELEKKLNIYERSYEEFCLEDSLRQSDQYE